jgi:hypothetical protein
MAKAKNEHGGRRANSGRKQSLSFQQRMEIGSLCEAKWSAMSEAAAWLEYESKPYIIDIREEQSRLSAISVKFRSDQKSTPDSESNELLTVAERIDEVSQEIDATLDSEGASRFSSTPVRRPQGAKEGLLGEVVESIGRVTGKKITKRMVKKCWDEFRSVQTRLKSDLS